MSHGHTCICYFPIASNDCLCSFLCASLDFAHVLWLLCCAVLRCPGHKDSFSAKRSLFDLQLLYRDLDVYGHDPHTHKYLGVTHLSYVVSLATSRNANGDNVIGGDGNLLTPELRDHFQKGNYYCEMRADPSTVYEDEFSEERWECMVQMGLAATVLVSQQQHQHASCLMHFYALCDIFV